MIIKVLLVSVNHCAIASLLAVLVSEIRPPAFFFVMHLCHSFCIKLYILSKKSVYFMILAQVDVYDLRLVIVSLRRIQFLPEIIVKMHHFLLLLWRLLWTPSLKPRSSRVWINVSALRGDLSRWRSSRLVFQQAGTLLQYTDIFSNKITMLSLQYYRLRMGRRLRN